VSCFRSAFDPSFSSHRPYLACEESSVDDLATFDVERDLRAFVERVTDLEPVMTERGSEEDAERREHPSAARLRH